MLLLIIETIVTPIQGETFILLRESYRVTIIELPVVVVVF